MNTRRFALIIYAGVIIAIAAFASLARNVSAQSPSCGSPAGLPCPPSGGGGGKKQKPPLILPTDTPSPTPNIIQTFTAQTLTAEAISRAPAPPAFDPADATATALESTYLQCYATIFPPLYQTAAAALTQTSNDWSSQAEATADVAVNQCAYVTPASPTPVVIPPVAGPQSLLPGVINIIAVLIIVVCFGGGIWYFFNHTSGRHRLVSADDLNPQPLPPKGMGDGSSQFAKIEDGSSQFGKVIPDGSNQFAKIEDDLNPQPLPPKGITGNMNDGSSQFGKVIPDGSNQFAKIKPNQSGPAAATDGSLTGNEIGGSGGEQL